jgi:hypothetical protein
MASKVSSERFRICRVLRQSATTSSSRVAADPAGDPLAEISSALAFACRASCRRPRRGDALLRSACAESRRPCRASGPSRKRRAHLAGAGGGSAPRYSCTLPSGVLLGRKPAVAMRGQFLPYDGSEQVFEAVRLDMKFHLPSSISNVRPAAERPQWRRLGRGTGCVSALPIWVEPDLGLGGSATSARLG